MGACCNKPFVKSEVTPRCNSILSRKASIFFEHISKQSDYKKKYEYISTLGSGGFGKVRLYKDKKNPNLCLLAAAQTRDKTAITGDQLKTICDELKDNLIVK